MTKQKIEETFDDIIKSKVKYGDAFYNKLSRITEDMIYNWRKGTRVKPPSFGDKLELLYELGLITINGPKPTTETPG